LKSLKALKLEKIRELKERQALIQARKEFYYPKLEK
jgi:hypothetical protein